MSFPQTLDLFCRVVDNFGDIGVCWRLARQLASEYGLQVTLWVDDLASFQKICSSVDCGQHLQAIQGVSVRHWQENFPPTSQEQIPDVVIEAFACHLPVAYVDAMVARQHAKPPVWINLEYLSAEPWVEGCHKLVSPHPGSALRKYFFFPGFSRATGGLLAERGLLARRDAFVRDQAAQTGFFASLGLQRGGARTMPDCRKISLFCYPDAPVEALFAAWQASPRPVLCLVPEGVASRPVSDFLRQTASVGAHASRDALTLQVIPFLEQAGYDKLLWVCDVNFVRGEDSFVRAQWAARPFVWQIYPQEEGAHLAKLDAFLTRYAHLWSRDPAAKAIMQMWHAWNRHPDQPGDVAACWRDFDSENLEILQHGIDWAKLIAENGDLASNLIQFIREID